MASGLPSDLIGGTFQARLSDAGMKVADIGMVGLATLPLMLKPLWAPAVDRFAPPLGRRRGWILISALVLCLSVGLLGTVDPSQSLMLLVSALAMTAFCSATLDLAVNGWTCDMAAESGSGTLAGWSVWGYRIAMLLSSSISLALSHRLGWSNTYWLLAGMLLVVVLIGLFQPEPSASAQAPVSLGQAVVTPFVHFWRDNGLVGMGVLLLFALLFRLADSWAGNQTTTFLNGFYSKDQLSIAKAAALVAVGLGVGAAALAERKLSTRALLLLAGVLGGASNLGFLLISEQAVGGLAGLYTAMMVESICGGFMSAVFVGFLMSRCRSSSAATQYAVLTSVWLLGRFLTAPAGIIVKSNGWSVFFVASAVAGLPGLLLVPWIKHSRSVSPSA